MPTLSTLSLPPPRNWQDFEDLCCDLWRRLWRDPGTQKNGRSGQPQAGLDVFGRPDQGALWAGVQCKVREEGSKLLLGDIKEEARKALTFRPSLSQLIIATTAQRDANAQRAARELTEVQTREGSFSVAIASWDDILLDLAEHPDLIAKHYPDLFVAIKQISFPASDVANWWFRSSGPFQAPALPRHFVQRAEITRILKMRLLAEGDAVPGVLAISAIHGLGGVGKSTLVAALLQDSDIKRRFSDGILWATLGQEPNPVEFLRAWIQALGDYEFQALSSSAASSHLATLLSQRSVLMIVDDAWKGAHALPFRVGGPRCRLIITTRRTDVADELAAELHEVDVMTPDEALRLLEARLGRSMPPAERDAALQLAKEVGYLPLALELSAVRVARGKSWETLTHALTEEIARLEELEGPRRRRSQDSNRLEISLGLSLDTLRREDPKAWEAFVWLGILKEDAFVTETSAATLWSCANQEASEILEVLRNDSLLVQGPLVRAGDSLEKSYRLHDVLGDIARRILTVPPPRGLGIELTAAHRNLLNQYHSLLTDERWHSVTEDGYICAHLAWHMEKAGRADLVHRLLQESTNDRLNGWYQTCERFGHTTVFVADLFRAWKLAEEGQGVEAGSDALALQCRYALIASTLSSLTQNLPPKLLRLLVKEKVWSPMQALIYIKRINDFSHQASSVIELAPLLGQTPFAVPMLEIIHGIPSISQKARSLAALAPFEASALADLRRLLLESWHDGLLFSQLSAFIDEQTARGILISILSYGESLDRDRMLAGFAGTLPQELFGLSLEAIGKIRCGRISVEAFRLVAQVLPETACERALDLAWQIVRPPDRLMALVALIPRLPEIQLKKLLSLVMTTGKTSHILAMLEASVSRLSDEMVTEALETVKNLRDLSERARALAALAPRCGVMWDQLDTATQEMESSLRVPVIARLADHVPESLVTEAASKVDQVTPETARAEVIAQLAPRITSSTGSMFVAAARKIRTESLRVKAMIACAPYLDEFLFNDLLESTESLSEAARVEFLTGLVKRVAAASPRCLELVARIEADWLRSRALARIAPHLKEDLFPELLRVLAGLRGDHERARCLVQVGPHLPDSQLIASLRLAETIRRPAWRASALLSLGARLPPGLREETQQQILSAARAIDDPATRKDVLSRLAAQVTPDLLPTLVSEAQAIRDGREQIDIAMRFSLTALESAIRFLEQRNGLKERALALLIGALGRKGVTRIVEDYLDRVLAIEDDAVRNETLCRVLPSMGKASLWKAIVFLKERGDFEAHKDSLLSVWYTFAHIFKEKGSGSVRIGTSDLRWQDYSFKLDVNEGFEESQEEKGPDAERPDEATGIHRLFGIDGAVNIEALASRRKKYGKEITELSKALALAASRLGGDRSVPALREVLKLARTIIEGLENDWWQQPGWFGLAAARGFQWQLDTTEEAMALRTALISVAARIEAEPRQARDVVEHHISRLSLRKALRVAEQIVEERLGEGVPAVIPRKGWGSAGEDLDDSAGTRILENQDKRKLQTVQAALFAAAARTRGNTGQALAALAPYLTQELLREALSLATIIVEETQRAEALSGLIPHLPAEFLEQALSAAIGISDDELRSSVIASSSSHLPPQLVGRAFESVAKSRDVSARVKGILALAPHLPSELRRSACLAILAIPQEAFRARGIAGLALSVRDEMRDTICREASALRDPGARALALLGLVSGDGLESRDLRKLLGEALHGMASLSRKEALRHLSVLAGVFEAHLETRVCGEILGALTDAGAWWP